MSTSYNVYSNNCIELVIDEHSSKLDITLISKIGPCLSLDNLTPIQVAAIGIELIRVAEYQDSVIRDLLEQSFPSDQLQAFSRQVLKK